MVASEVFGVTMTENARVEEIPSEVQLVVFRLSKGEYGLPITKVQEINRLVPITKLPQTPAFMEGIINLRGRIIPVIDLRKRFQLERLTQDQDEESRIIIVEVNRQTVGIIVDEVREVTRLRRDCIEPPPQGFVLEEQYVDGVGKQEGRILILLNIDQILSGREEIILKEMSR